ncbi:hypothetical protein LXL04_007344 [Taraxacum kok-saghyz]
MHILHMNKGDGETSYAKSSLLQKKIIAVGIPMVEAAIVNIVCELLQLDECMGLADLGCSSGPNSLTVIQQLVYLCATAHLVPKDPGSRPPKSKPRLASASTFTHHVGFLAVHGSTRPLTWSLIWGKSPHVAAARSRTPDLCPMKDYNPVPVGLGPYSNKEKIYISKSSSASVVEAYREQFKEDFSTFLMSRSKEVIIKGRMVLSFLGRMSPDPFADEVCFQWENLARSLMSLASDGLLEKEMIDSFNIPYYAPTPKEVEHEVANEGSFVVDGFEAFEIDWDVGDSSTIIKESSGHRMAKTMRAGLEPMFGSHFHLGPELMDELFRRFAIIIDDCFSKRRHKFPNLVFSLIKKG